MVTAWGPICPAWLPGGVRGGGGAGRDVVPPVAAREVHHILHELPSAPQVGRAPVPSIPGPAIDFHHALLQQVSRPALLGRLRWAGRRQPCFQATGPSSCSRMNLQTPLSGNVKQPATHCLERSRHSFTAIAPSLAPRRCGGISPWLEEVLAHKSCC